MDYVQLKKDLEGLYITIPTLFHDEDLSINEKGIRTHIRFLKENGINKENAVLLAGGAAGEASKASNVGMIIYNTFWTSAEVSFELVERLTKIPQVIGLKWATTRSVAMEFEDVVHSFAGQFCFIDNDLLFPISHMLGARAFEVHLCNHWPEWGVKLLKTLEAGDYKQVEMDMVEEAKPFYKLWKKIEMEYTRGDGFLDKLCMELVGMPSSRCRPPTRDIRERYRQEAKQMLIESGTPRVQI